MRKLFLTLMLLFSFIFYSGATDGYFSNGYGAISKGLAGSGIGLPITSLVNGNPAGLSFAPAGWNINVDLFSPKRQFTVEGNPSGYPGTLPLVPGRVESESNLFVIPAINANFHVGEKSALSFSVFGHGGMNTNWPTAVFHDPSSSSTGVDLAQAFASVSYSYIFAPKHAIGVTANLVAQRFKIEGVGSFAGFSADPQNLSGNGYDASVGFGFKVGYLGEVLPNFTIGITYASEANTGSFDKYAGLFAGGGGFDVPASLTAGCAWRVDDQTLLTFDFKRIFYEGVGSVSNPMFDGRTFNPLGSENGAGFGWQNISVLKFGAEHQLTDAVAIRGGISFGDQPIPESEVLFNILAPGVIQNHFAAGVSIHNKYHFSITRALQGKVKGVNPLDPAQTIQLSMDQLEFSFGYTL